MLIKNLRESREEYDLKQKDIAKVFNVHPSTVSGWETGKDSMPIKKLIIYANLYGYSLDYLFGIKWRNENYYPIIINKFSIGKNLRKLRIKNNDTESSLALKLNTTQSTVSNWERGKTIISTTFIVGLTKVYDNFSIDKLFNRIKDNNKNNLRF